MKKRDLILIVIGIIIGVVIFLVFFNTNNDAISTKDTAKDSTTKTRKILYWKAPMNPSEVYDKPGKSAMGMDLVPVYEDQAGEAGVVKIDPVVQQNMNVKTEVVESKKINPLVITNGILQTDERKEFIVTTKVGGWIEKLYVNFTGQEVKKGEKLSKENILVKKSGNGEIKAVGNKNILGKIAKRNIKKNTQLKYGYIE